MGRRRRPRSGSSFADTFAFAFSWGGALVGRAADWRTRPPDVFVSANG